MTQINSLLSNINILLAQSAQEKRLTILYVTLFVFAMVILLIDSREGKKWVGDNKILAKIIAVVLVISIVALVVLYFVL